MFHTIPSLQELCVEKYNELSTQVDLEGIIYQRKKRIIFSIVLLGSTKSFALDEKSIEKIKNNELNELKFTSNLNCDIFGICELIDLIEIIKSEFSSIETERIFNSEEFISILTFSDNLFKFKLDLKFELKVNNSSNFFSNLDLSIKYFKE